MLESFKGINVEITAKNHPSVESRVIVTIKQLHDSFRGPGRAVRLMTSYCGDKLPRKQNTPLDTDSYSLSSSSYSQFLYQYREGYDASGYYAAKRFKENEYEMN